MTSDKQFLHLYSASKLKYPHALFLMQKQRVYIAFDQDAKIVSAVLGIEIANGTKEEPPSVSIAYQGLQKAMKRLLNKGHMVAVGRKPRKKDPVFDQLECVRLEIELYILEASDN